jgi:hypothetical protein
MPHPFLSDAWFDAFDEIRGEAPPPPPAAADITINVLVAGGPEGDVPMHMAGGQLERGLKDDAPTKMTVPYEVAKSLFVKNDPQAAMQAFMSGQIKVEGDMTKLMQMQAGGPPSAEQLAFQEKVKEITEIEV